jgi:tRNA threonylcarbamoyladenosine biosynthesis protein TsaE
VERQEPDTLRFVTTTPEETRRFGSALGASLEPGAFVGLEGPLGSGKTVVVQGAARALGYDGYVTSPSFVIVNEYEGRLSMFHVDLYRVAGAQELDDIGYREVFFGDGVALVEWSDRADEFLPSDRLEIAIRMERGDVRIFRVSALGEQAARVLARIRSNWSEKRLPCSC